MRRLAALACLGLALAGCAADELALPAGVENLAVQCRGDGDCKGGTVCKPGYAVCVAPAPYPAEIGLAVSPPASIAPPVHLDTLVPDDNTLDLTLPRTVVVTGAVRVGLANVDATLVAEPKDQVIKGASLRVQTPSNAGTGYHLLLLAGVDYALTVLVDGSPTWHQDVRYDADAADADILLPAEVPHLTGRVYWTQGGPPCKGVQVTAIHEVTHDQCTQAATDKLGSYDLQCPNATGPYRVIVNRLEDGPIVPTFTAMIVDPKASRNLHDADPLPDIVIGELPPEVDATLKVVAEDTGAPLGGVEVTASTTLPATDGWTSAVLWHHGVTNADGDVTFRVLEGAYRLTVAPHPTEPWAILRDPEGDADPPTWEVKAMPPNNLVPVRTIALHPKVSVAGAVLDHGDLPVAGAKVVALARLVDAATNTVTTREYVTETGAGGAWSLQLDALAYDISVVPAEASALPRAWSTLDARALDGAPVVLRLHAPSLVQGRLLDNGGAPVPSATLDVYDPTGDGAAKLIGRGATDADGRWYVILPSP